MAGLALLGLALAQPAPAAKTPAGGAPQLREAAYVFYGPQSAAFVRLDGTGGSAFDPSEDGRSVGRARVKIDVMEQAPPRHILLLNGPWSGAGGWARFKAALRRELQPTGWQVEERTMDEWSREREARVVVLPSGAWPEKLMKNWNASLGSQDVLVYFGVRQNVTLDSDGLASAGGVRNELLAGGRPLDGGLEGAQTLKGPQGVRVWRLGRTLDEYVNMDALAANVSEALVRMPGVERIGQTEGEWGGGPYTGLAVFGEPRRAHVRIRVHEAGGRLLALWDRELALPVGNMDGPIEAVPGQAAAFQVRLALPYAQTERVEYTVQVVGADQKVRSRQILGGGRMGGAGGNATPMWVGSFVYSNWSQGGWERLEVMDQYGRSYAQAAVQVPLYQVKELDGDGLTRRYLLTRNGAPARASSVRVRREDSGRWNDLPLQDGIVRVSSKWTLGPHLLSFDMEGIPLRFQWVEGEGGAWGAAGRIGVPGLLLAALIYILLRPRARPSYRLQIPEFLDWTLRRRVVRPDEMMGFVRASGPKHSGVVRSSDVVEYLHHPPPESARHRRARGGPATGWPSAKEPVSAGGWDARPGTARAVTPESVELALAELERRGLLLRWREFYAPRKSMRDRDALRRHALGRMLMDKMLESGKTLRPHQGDRAGVRMFLDGEGGTWAIGDEKWRPAPGSRSGRVAAGRVGRTGPLPDRLVFADENERRAFEKALQADETAAGARLRLALATARMHLICAERPLAD